MNSTMMPRTASAVSDPGEQTSADGTDIECMVDGYREGLRRWKESCPCCFGAAHPEGLEAAVEAARG